MLAIRPPADSSAVMDEGSEQRGKAGDDGAAHGHGRRQHERRHMEDPQDQLPQYQKRREDGEGVGDSDEALLHGDGGCVRWRVQPFERRKARGQRRKGCDHAVSWRSTVLRRFPCTSASLRACDTFAMSSSNCGCRAARRCAAGKIDGEHGVDASRVGSQHDDARGEKNGFRHRVRDEDGGPFLLARAGATILRSGGRGTFHRGRRRARPSAAACGLVASARAMETRIFMPPESSRG